MAELQGALKAYTSQRIDTEANADANALVLDKAETQCENELALQKPKQNAQAQGKKPAIPAAMRYVHAPSKLDPSCDPSFKPESAVIKKFVAAAQKSELPARLNGTQRLALAQSELSGINTALSTYIPTATWPTALQAAVKQLQALQATVLSNVSVSRFFVEIPEDCNGLYGAARTTTITVQRYDNEKNSVVVTCASRVFTTGGFAFGFIPQRTYTAVAANPAVPQAPPGSPTPPPAMIEEGAVSDIRPIPVVLLNVRFAPGEGPIDNDFYLSFGVSVNSGPQTTTLDYLAGLSYSISRQMVITGGIQLGPENTLLPGVATGQGIAVNTQPQTITRMRLGPFVAITYGPH
jgi:hypothetical protein